MYKSIFQHMINITTDNIKIIMVSHETWAFILYMMVSLQINPDSFDSSLSTVIVMF